MAGVKQFDERQLLEKAMEVFWRRGFAETSMVDLARATKVQRGSLYHAYADKEAIFLKAYDLYAARFLEQIRSALAKPALADALRAAFAAGIANMCSGRPSRGCLTTRTAMEAAALSPTVAGRVRAVLEALEDMLAERIGADRDFTGDARAAARLVVALTRGLAVIERAYGDPKRLQSIADDAVRMIVAESGRRH